MTTWIKVAIVAVANVASFVGGYFLGKKAEKDEKAEKEETVTVTLTSEDLDAMRGALEEELPTVEQISQEMHSYAEDLRAKRFSTFNEVFGETDKSDDKEEDEEPEEEEVTVEDPDEGPYEPARSESKDAYLITPEEMDHSNYHYIKEELKYFIGDSVLITEDESVVSDILAYIGQEGIDALNKLAEESEGYYTDETICVRNDRIGSDFEIVIMPGSYEDYFGLPEPEEDEDI